MKFFKEAEGKWLKGCLHLHTKYYDGQKTIEELAAIYANSKYRFLVVTDHRMVSQPPKELSGLIIISGAEIDVGLVHAIGVGMTELPEGLPYSNTADLLRIREKAGFSFLGHPNWSNMSFEDVKALSAFGALEVFNGGCEMKIARGHSEYVWDNILSAGIKMNAVATDDSHQKLQDYAKGWVYVKTNDESEAGIIKALNEGHYYSSNGPEIRTIIVDEKGIEVVTTKCRQIRFIAKTLQGKVFESEKPLTKARYEFTGEEGYVRVECVDFEGKKAWSNPYYPKLR